MVSREKLTFWAFCVVGSFALSLAEPSCDGRPNGDFFRDPNDCSVFYQCSNGTPVKTVCAGTLVFNENIDSCDWPHNVDCSDSSDNNPDATTTTTTTTTTTAAPTANNPTPATSTAATTKSTITTSSTRTTTATTKSDANSGCARRVCYYTNWSQYRPTGGKFFPENIDVSLCSHLVYAFAKLTGNHLEAFEGNDESTSLKKGMYERFNDMTKNTNVKTLLAVGGWTLGTGPFAQMVATEESRRDFAEHSVGFLKERGFDGLDLDWEYPGSRDSLPHDKGRFTLLVKQLRKTYDDDAAANGGSPLLLTAAVAAGRGTIDKAYEISEISTHLDFISLMSYDLHGSWEKFTGHHGALYPRSDETGDQRYLNVDSAARYWVEKGCPKDKLVIGIPTYARTFTLESSSDYGPGAPASGAGRQGAYTREGGVLSYYEVCEMRTTADAPRRISSQKVPYLVSGDQWVGYEDTDSVREKARYAMTNGYGGVMTWSLALDDFTGTFCGEGEYPLWSAVNDQCRA